MGSFDAENCFLANVPGPFWQIPEAASTTVFPLSMEGQIDTRQSLLERLGH